MKIECNKKVECRGVDTDTECPAILLSFLSILSRSSYEDFEFECYSVLRTGRSRRLIFTVL